MLTIYLHNFIKALHNHFKNLYNILYNRVEVIDMDEKKLNEKLINLKRRNNLNNIIIIILLVILLIVCAIAVYVRVV